MIRDLQLCDFTGVEDLHNNEFPLPNINSPLNFVQKVIVEDGEILGAFFVSLTSEVSLVLGDKLTSLKKAKLIKEIFTLLLKELSEKGLQDTHVFILPETDERYAKFLMRHFQFEKCKGIPMYLRRSFLHVKSAKPECSKLCK